MGKMTKNNLKDFRNKKKKLKEEKDAVTETIEVKKKVIEKEADSVRELSQISNNFDAVSDMYSNVPEAQVAEMKNDEYKVFSRPISDLLISGAPVFPIRDESKDMLDHAERHNVILAATGSATSTTTSAAEAVAVIFPQSFPNREEIIKKYKPQKELKKQIGYIKSQLSVIDPDVHRDFEAFLRKFDVIGEKGTKYQDLIGCRSIIFLRLIFNFAENNFSVTINNGRKEQIKTFVFGSSPYDSSADTIIETAELLWRELSGNVKTGQISVAQVDVIFSRMIGVIASLLKLREKHFSP